MAADPQPPRPLDAGPAPVGADVPLWARWPWLTRNVLALGLVSLFNDASTEMILPLLPAFVTTVLGGGALALGLIEGTADMVASVLKLGSGWLADRTGRRRPWVLLGYGVSAVTRPFIAATATPLQVLGIRVVDRTGKGLRTSPRDSLIAASVDDTRRGTAFGFHQALDHLGAIVGPLLALLVLALAGQHLRTVFWWSALPAALTLAVLFFGVREVRGPVPEKAPLLAGAPPGLLRFLLPLAVFTLGNSTDVFLLLKAGAEKTPLYGLPLLWIGLHVVRSATSIPGGRLADSRGPRAAITAGWIIFVAVYVGFAFAGDQWTVAALFMVYGLYDGLTVGAQKALVAAAVPETSRGTAFGWFHLTVGVLTLPASVLFGALWDAYGSRAAFLTSAGLALLALVLLRVLVPARPAAPGPAATDAG